MIKIKNSLHLSSKLINYKIFQYAINSNAKFFITKAKPIRYNKNEGWNKFDNKQTNNKGVGLQYWETVYPKIEPHVVKLVKMILNQKSSNKQIMRQLQEYLEFRTYTFQVGKRSELGCMLLLVALNLSSHQLSFEQYQYRIIDFITLSNLKNSQYDSVMIKYFCLALHKRISTNIQKNIRQFYRLRYVQIVLDNFQRIDNFDLEMILTQVLQNVRKDHYNFITKWRFYPVFTALHKRNISLMKQFVDSTSNFQKSQFLNILKTNYIMHYQSALHFFGLNEKQQGRIFFQFMKARAQFRKQDIFFFKAQTNFLVQFPYIEINQQGETFNDKYLQYFQQKLNQSSAFRTLYHEESTWKKFLIHRAFEDQFYRAYKKLSFEDHQKKYKILRKAEFKKPIIKDFVWRVFKEDEDKCLTMNIINDIIYSMYPEKISNKNIQKKIEEVKMHGNVDNQFTFRVWEVLNRLGYTFQKQKKIHQRQVDILIDDSIIIELQGQNHYNYKTKEQKPSTAFRNYHLMYQGYKLVIITTFQYNTCRQKRNLQKLVQQKLQLVKREDILMVE